MKTDAIARGAASRVPGPGSKVQGPGIGVAGSTPGARSTLHPGPGTLDPGPGTRHSGSRISDFLTLTKPRLNSLVVITAGVAYYLGHRAAFDLPMFFHAVVGSALVAGGAAALNQIAERDIDERMHRTRTRPMPAGRLQVAEARVFAIALSLAGLVQLASGANLLAAAVALVTLLSYTAIYTPLKRRTPWATLVGAVPGALPPLIGWAAAQGTLTPGAWVLFAIVFLWQMPHFHALAWLFRDDFRRAHLPLLAVTDSDGRTTATHTLVYAALLVPVSLLPSAVGLTGRFYLPGAVILSTGFLIVVVRFALNRSAERARTLFLGSLVYLPALWALMIADRVLQR